VLVLPAYGEPAQPVAQLIARLEEHAATLREQLRAQGSTQ
jgi:hypothetical protein